MKYSKIYCWEIKDKKHSSHGDKVRNYKKGVSKLHDPGKHAQTLMKAWHIGFSADSEGSLTCYTQINHCSHIDSFSYIKLNS